MNTVYISPKAKKIMKKYGSIGRWMKIKNISLEQLKEYSRTRRNASFA